jgi:hypothetical protein
VADILNIISSNYLTVGQSVNLSSSKYVNVDPDLYQGNWNGKYASGQSFSVSISNVNGFRAKAKYQSGAIIKYQDVLIRDNAFRIGDSKFTLTKIGKAQIKTVLTDPATGAQSLETAYAKLS